MSRTSDDLVVGIDLGTTNSEVAALHDGRVIVLGQGDARILPSCVGLSPDGQLLVGEAARNQALVYPERTVRSIKRRMGSSEPVRLGESSFSPQEISALILRALRRTAEQELGEPVRRAVITVPAYFSDSQRQATREAGALADLEVLRILNEPTAASLAYGYGAADTSGSVLIYDLGGGTFDVSIVTIEDGVTEVLASHGNNQLGGDDFDRLLVDRLTGEIEQAHGVDLQGAHPAAHARLHWAAQQAKHQLSFEPYARIREEALLTLDGRPIHVDREITREEYEALIRPLVESTLDSVARALDDAGKRAADLDAVLLVGGVTRTPLVMQVLEERLGRRPREDVHPDLCVALGSGVLAARLAGHSVERVLVDVSPYSFGPSHLGLLGGEEYPYCYRPLIRRNTPLPVTRTASYYTSSPFQDTAEISIYQGEDTDALRNTFVGEFLIEGLEPTNEPNEVLVRMSLDLDGILQVTAIEKHTGKSKQITIEGALARQTERELAAGRERLDALAQADSIEASFAAGGAEAGAAPPWVEATGSGALEAGTRESATVGSATVGSATPGSATPGAAPSEAVALGGEQAAAAAAGAGHAAEARQLLTRARSLLDQIHEEDREEVVDLERTIEQAITSGDSSTLSEATGELRELLFFVEGR
jgi:molecular chaperone DnaK (HSP70)